MEELRKDFEDREGLPRILQSNFTLYSTGTVFRNILDTILRPYINVACVSKLGFHDSSTPLFAYLIQRLKPFNP